MMKILSAVAFLALASVAAGQDGPTPNVEAMAYSHEGFELEGFLAKPQGVTINDPVPAVVIVP